MRAIYPPFLDYAELITNLSLLNLTSQTNKSGYSRIPSITMESS